MFYERLHTSKKSYTIFSSKKPGLACERCTLGSTEEGKEKSILAVNYTMFAQNSSTNSQDAKKSRSGRDMSHLSIRHGIEAK